LTYCILVLKTTNVNPKHNAHPPISVLVIRYTPGSDLHFCSKRSQHFAIASCLKVLVQFTIQFCNTITADSLPLKW